ncbi:unnamed protein product [Arctogadus glacialis]
MWSECPPPRCGLSARPLHVGGVPAPSMWTECPPPPCGLRLRAAVRDKQGEGTDCSVGPGVSSPGVSSVGPGVSSVTADSGFSTGSAARGASNSSADHQNRGPHPSCAGVTGRNRQSHRWH